MICALLVFQTPDLPAPLTTLSPWLDMRLRPVEEVHAALDAQTHRRFIKTHTPLDGLPDADGVTYVVVGRDPRDVAVSMDHHFANLNFDVIERLLSQAADRPPSEDAAAPAPQWTADRRQRLLRWIDDDDPPSVTLSSLRGTIWHLADAWTRRHETDVVLVHYGDLSRDLEGEMRRLAGRLGITVPERRWPELVEAATFHRMRARSTEVVPDERLGLFTDSRSFFHTGSSGQWRDVLTDQDIHRYHQRLDSIAPTDLVHWLHHGAASQ
jgi:hypothetical protein